MKKLLLISIVALLLCGCEKSEAIIGSSSSSDKAEGIAYGIIYNDIDKITESEILSSYSKQDIIEYISNAEKHSTIESIVIDEILPNNNSVKDKTIMVNVKADYEDNKYNKLYLFEFHIGADGKVYGYNFWKY